MIRIIIGAILSAVVMFFWGFVYWTILPFQFFAIQGLPKVNNVQEVNADHPVVLSVHEHLPSTGTYIYPFWDEDSDNRQAEEKRVVELQRQGPLFYITYIKEGVEPMGPMIFILGGIHFLVAALVLASILWSASPGLATFGQRALFVILVGLFAAIFIDLSSIIWMHHPWEYPVYNFIYHVTSVILVSPVLALIVKKPATV